MTTINNKLVSAEVEFEILDDIGAEGRNADVFRIRDQQLEVELAAKQIPRSDFRTPGQYFEEARKLAQAAHPNVVPVQYAGFDTQGDHVYTVMPFFKKGSVQGLMDQRLLTVREVVRYGLQFLTGLAHIHTLGLVHFDIKPSNILLDDSGMAMLSDFGLAKYLSSFGVAIQSSLYKAHIIPERYTDGAFLTEKADMYQAGLTLYRMCNGNGWFREQLARFTNPDRIQEADLQAPLEDGRFPDRSAYLPHVPRRLRRAINRALEPDPDDRFDTVRDMMNEIGKVERYLDWKPSFDDATEQWAWRLDEPELTKPRTRTLTVTKNNGGFDVEGRKIITTDRSVGDWCSDGLPDRGSAFSFVQRCIRGTDS